MSQDIKKIVLAYSGGLDTSVILHWLKETYQCPVVAYAADVGQGEDLEGIREKALNTGADEVIIEDLKEEFVRDFVWPALRANAIYESAYLLGTSLARPIIARGQVEAARKVGADAVSHGATGKGNDQVRFELTYMALEPGLKIIAPWRIWDFRGREDLIAYAKSHGIPVPVTKEKPYSCDSNLLHISFEAGILEDTWKEPPEDMFVLTVSPEKAPDKATYIEITFEKGTPVAVDGKPMRPAELLAHVNRLGGENGIGRVDLVENRYVGMKSRGVYETPGGTILRIAHMAMESITMDREVMHIRDSLLPRYAEMIYYGYWFSPEREMMQALIDESQKNVTGVVRLKLYKGNCIVVGRKSDVSLYDPDFATFEGDEVYNQKDAEGFIRLSGLRIKIAKLLERRRSAV
ncbi:MAG: argininosuccinate synthase [Deltaproteobacteria bacterium]|nr:argininosuccinate synthase [Deltaproteobacteria bacterium]MBW1928047.1 argininosuccinate synthase [Deltaproteobacteria bacterium]MBW2024963.1 argininosuccinate synthase [Deltaproteobacteria bacterium]MBW2127324.1 argininosuccinate synthase [Deltaproteobacteria bacterium]